MRLVDELLGQQHPPRLGDGHGRSAEMLAELAPQLPFPHAQALGQRVHAVLVQRAKLDQLQRARHAVRQFVPGTQLGRGLRPAAQAGVVAGFLRGGRGGVEGDVLR
ncbi:hypothetical protein D3C85_1118250 [compost metagenome]